MRRREFITLLGGAAAAWPVVARGQQKRPRIGVLVVANPEPFWGQFREGLRELGYVEGQNIEFEFRSAEGKLNALPDLAAKLVQLKVDIIVANQTPAVLAAKKATNDIPIIMAPSGDPVGTGLVASLARPGGNVTGLSSATAEIAGKSLEVLREMLPAASRVAVLANPTDPFAKPFLQQIEIAAKVLGIEIQTIMVLGPEQLGASFSQIDKNKTAAVIVQPSLPRQHAADLALLHHLASVCPTGGFAQMGGLMSYAGKPQDTHREAATYVDKILKGAKPANLPVQQPTRFELGINLKTAKALGLTISPTMLNRADEVIE